VEGEPGPEQVDVAAALILLQAFRNVRLDGSRPSRDLPEEKAA